MLMCGLISVAAKGDTEPERNETRNKVDEDRKHEYPFLFVTVSLCNDCIAWIQS